MNTINHDDRRAALDERARRTLRAVEHYHETAREFDVAEEREPFEPASTWGSPGWNLALDRLRDAKLELTFAILACADNFRWSNVAKCLRRRHEPRGVRVGDQVYLAISDPNSEGEPDVDIGWTRMQLVVMSASAILDLDRAGASPGSVASGPDRRTSPAPPGPAVEVALGKHVDVHPRGEEWASDRVTASGLRPVSCNPRQKPAGIPKITRE